MKLTPESQPTSEEWNRHISTVLEAIVFAAEKHSLGRRKDANKSPYIEHPLRVMRHLIRAGVTNPVTLMVAVLHDTVEDTETTFAEISNLFGSYVETGVRDVTDDKSLPTVESKKMQVVHTNSQTMSISGCLVKMADKLDNVLDRVNNPPLFCSPQENEGYIIWSIHVVAPLVFLNAGLKKQLEDVFVAAKVGFEDFETFLFKQDTAQRLETYYKLVQERDEKKKNSLK
jgi:GTP diphosphokinase / guanosine-3',5'-bis(diphosphate) 3'-diphosphatase